MNRIYTSLFYLIVFSLFIFARAGAQIAITPSATAYQLASKLTGPGVTILSPTLTCTSTAEGIFVGTSTLSFDSGIVLTTGSAATDSSTFTFGANGPASNFANTDNFAPGDPDLEALAGLTTNDACVLEFDFKPAGDTVKFNYVFGSEEYTAYTCSSFNDVFGFFISGPGYASATNIALVPGTTIPVCINSVNCGATGVFSTSTCSALGPGSPFCTYYVNNSTGSTITYDGLTTTLTAIANVTPCDTYHLKIGIADGSDFEFDSGVFIEAGSLTSTGISVTPLGSSPTDTTFGGQFCIRGCLPGKFVFNLTNPVAAGLTIHYNIGGTAVNGVDYTSIPDSVVIAPGGSSAIINVYGLPAAATGPKTVELYTLAPYTCGGAAVIIDSATITIYDSFSVSILTPDTSVCIGASFTLRGGGDANLHYTWSPAPASGSDTSLTLFVNPPATTTYTLSGVYPGTGCPPSVVTETVSVIQALSVNVGPRVQNTCVGIPLQLNAAVTPAAGSYTYSWSPSTDLSSSIIANPVVTPTAPGNTEYVATVTETTAHCVASDSFTLHVVPNDFTLLNQDSGVCFNATVLLQAVGSPEFAYSWTPAAFVHDPTQISTVASFNSTTTFTLTASYPGCPDINHSVLYYVESPHVDILTNDTSFCVGDTIHLAVSVTPADSPFVYNWSPAANLYNPGDLQPYFTSTIVGDYPFSLAIQSPLGCSSVDGVVLSPKPPALISATPGVTTIAYGSSVTLDAVNLTSYPLVYWWTPDNGSLNNNNINNPIASPLDSTTYTVYAMNEWGCRDSASLTVDVSNIGDVVIPTGFTPNNDGLNDVFRVLNYRNQKLVEFSIYNRWGQLLFQNNTDPKKGWDGTYNGQLQDMGVYNYVIILAKADGTNVEYKGAVTLLR